MSDTGELPYDPGNEDSIIEYASRLTGNTLRDLIDTGEEYIGGVSSKGYFGQILEEEYFHIPNNSRASADFEEAGIELKTVPMKAEMGNRLVVKERMVLGIIDYNEVPRLGFATFSKKSSHILIVFYQWEKGALIEDYLILKVVDWTPTYEELRVIHEDWAIIEGFIDRGEAHLLSERFTRFLAACTKGAGHGGDMRSQPFSDVPAKQRALSLKPSFMNMIYQTKDDVNDTIAAGKAMDDMGSLFDQQWSEGKRFEEFVLDHFDRFSGRTCSEIEGMLGIDLNDRAKSYYSMLCVNMMGISGKKRVKEFEQANIQMKTVRIRRDGRPKESMSFPAFRYEEVASQGWEESDFLEQLDRRFFIPVFQFPSDVTDGVPRKDLVFRGAFFWSIPEEDLETAHQVWEDTKSKIIGKRFDEFVRCSERRVSHVRPHGRDSRDTYPYDGEEHIKRCFWLNDNYIQRIVGNNLDCF